ncbi:sigma-70 family RNA polymerase sigma factor [Jatrophihabitans sp.]|uniref:sigma-70 family RNA polymerase sigma factor n=1 Tax=Jatrophihabitans sp. TaxID=1932789 RepID=UPI0030C76E81
MPITAVSDDFDQLFRRNWLAMVRLAGLLVDDVATAEDVAQDAFVAFQRRRTTVRTPDAELAYLRTCVINGARSVLRRRAVARRHLVSVSDSTAQTLVTAEVLAAPEDSELLIAVRSLPRRQREVLVLRYWLDLAHADVARLLGVSESTAKSTASRALDALEALMKEPR